MKGGSVESIGDRGRRNVASTPQVIGNYAIGETIGKGTYGVVKLGTHQFTKQQVAIKIVDHSLLSAVQREVETWRHLRHCHIAQLYEVLYSETKVYLVMEYASYGELFDYLVSWDRLREREGRHIFRQLAAAIGYCHKNGYVHRDLKPENLLLDDNLDLKVIDFGFMRHVEPNRLLNTFCGSVSYAAPELVMKAKYSGPESDIWSMGVVLFALLCGRLPFDDPDGDEKVIFDKIVRLDYEFAPGVSAGARNLIENILKLEPKERLTIEEILLHPWLHDDRGSTDDVAAEHKDIGVSANPHIVAAARALLDETEVLGDTELDREVLCRLASIGIDVAALKKAVAAHECDANTAMFFLVKRVVAKQLNATNAKKNDMRLPEKKAQSSSSLLPPAPRIALGAVNAGVMYGSACSLMSPPLPPLPPVSAPSAKGGPPSSYAKMLLRGDIPARPGSSSSLMGAASAPAAAPGGSSASLFHNIIQEEDEEDDARPAITAATGAVTAPPSADGPFSGSAVFSSSRSRSSSAIRHGERAADTNAAWGNASSSPSLLMLPPPVYSLRRTSGGNVPSTGRFAGARSDSASGGDAAATSTAAASTSLSPPSSPMLGSSPTSSTTSPLSPHHARSSSAVHPPPSLDIPPCDSNAPANVSPGRRFSLDTDKQAPKSKQAAAVKRSAPCPSPPPVRRASGALVTSSSCELGQPPTAELLAAASPAPPPGGVLPRRESVHSDSGAKVRKVKTGIFNMLTTSTKRPPVIAAEVNRVLTAKGFRYEQIDDYKFIIEAMNADEDSNSDESIDLVSALTLLSPSSEDTARSSIKGTGSAEDALKRVRFQIEICRLPGIALYGIKLKRLKGDTWAYKELCKRVIDSLRL